MYLKLVNVPLTLFKDDEYWAVIFVHVHVGLLNLLKLIDDYLSIKINNVYKCSILLNLTTSLINYR